MNRVFFKAGLIFFVWLGVQSGSFATETVPDIRYRNIVYFYPDKVALERSVLAKAFPYFELVDELPATASKPVLSYNLIRNFEDSYPVPDLNYLGYFGRGLDKQQATLIQGSKLALIIDVAYPAAMSYAGLSATSTSLYQFAKSNEGLIWDSETRELFTPSAWKQKRLDGWASGKTPSVVDHTVIHAYRHDEGVRAITLGMAKFGMPDVVVNNFSWSLNTSIGNLINLVAQSIMEGAVPDKNGMLKLNISALDDTRYKHDLKADLIENAQEQVNLLIGEAKWEQGDPENYLIEILFDNVQGASLSERQESLLSGVFGWEDKISYVRHNALIEAASARARNKLPGLRADFNDGLAPGEFIQVKAPFDTPDGGHEWMWVEVMSWRGNEIKGLLKNEPYNIPDLKGGSEVVVNEDEVFDYIRTYPDGRSEGNETAELIMKFQR